MSALSLCFHTLYAALMIILILAPDRRSMNICNFELCIMVLACFKPVWKAIKGTIDALKIWNIRRALRRALKKKCSLTQRPRTFCCVILLLLVVVLGTRSLVLLVVRELILVVLLVVLLVL